MTRSKCTKTDKHRYPDQVEADLAMADIHRANTHNRHRKYREEPCRSYLCPDCGGWHLTSLSLDEYESRRTVSY